jgi:hypothetical protein
MSQTILTQSTKVYEYSFSLINTKSNDYQDNLTAAFTNIPTLQDWLEWLSGWTRSGYCLATAPRLIDCYRSPN